MVSQKDITTIRVSKKTAARLNKLRPTLHFKTENDNIDSVIRLLLACWNHTGKKEAEEDKVKK